MEQASAQAASVPPGGPPPRRWWPWAAGVAGGAAILAAAIGVVQWRGLLSTPAGRQAARGGIAHIISQGAAQAILGTKPINILLIGNNARGATNPLDPGQADLSFLVQVDPATDRVTFVAIPRDTMVAYPGWNDPIPKFKSAFLMGGPKLAMKEASRLLGLKIDAYVATDFQGFVSAINAVGGVRVRINGNLYDPIHSHANIRPGVHRLGGRVALAYVRIRQNQAGNGLRTNDFERMQAAFGLMAVLRGEVFHHPTPSKVLSLYDAWSKDVATNLSKGQLIALALLSEHAHLKVLHLGSMADTMGIASTPLHGVNATGLVEGADYVILSDNQIARTLRPLGAENPRTGLSGLPPPAKVPVTVSDTPDGEAFAADLEKKGFAVTLSAAVATAPGGQLTVVYPAGELSAAEAVGRGLEAADEELVEASVPGVEVQAP